MRSLRLSLLALTVVAVSCGQNPTPPPNDLQAPDAPTRQKAVASPGSATLTWKNASDDDFALTLVARYSIGDAPVKPTGTPAVGDRLGTGLVVYVGSETTFIDAAVPTGCGPYFWALWSRDTSGNWSGGASTIELSRGATSYPPTSPVTNFTATLLGNSVDLRWVNPDSQTGFYQAVVLRKAGSTAPTSSTDGTNVFTGMQSQTTDTFTNTQSYSVFSCNACGLCSTAAVSLSVSRSDAGAPDAGLDAGSDAGIDAGTSDAGVSALTPTNLSAALSVDGQNVALRWTNATSAALTGVKLVRALNARPAGPDDTAATTVFQGLATTATERVDQLLPDLPTQPRTYFYSVYGCSNLGCESAGANNSFSITLKQALRGGGYTLFWRHCSASTCGDATNLGTAATTATPNWWKTCSTDCAFSTARQLTDPNAANEIFSIGNFFRTNGVTISRILSSEYCRAKASATGFNFGPAVEELQELTYFVYDEANRCYASNALLNITPAVGTNIGMVSHAGFVCPTLDSLAWGEAAIYKPQAPSTRTCAAPGNTCMNNEGCQNGFCVRPLFIGRVTAFDWAALTP